MPAAARASRAAARSASPAPPPPTLAQALRDRRTPLSGPRKIYVKELLQAIALADRLLDAPDVRHLHAHFAHGTTTITWHAARIAGLPFSFTGHARDIYAEHLNPKGWLRRKLLAARFVVTCTEANVRHLAGDRARGATCTSSTTGSTPTSRACSPTPRRRAPRPTATRCASSPSAASWPRRASTCSSTRAPCCAAAASPFEAAIVGQDDKHSDAVRERIAAPRPRGRTCACPARWARSELLREYRRASALCMPSRLLADDRDGIPNVLVEAMAAGHAGRSRAPSPASPSSSSTSVNGAARRARGPRGAGRRAACGCTATPRCRTRLAERGARDRRAPLRRPARRRAGSPSCSRRRSRVTSAVARRPRPVLCVTEHEHRSRAVADGVRAGRFTVAGETRVLGTDPDWLGARPARRRGVADRVGEVRAGGSTSRTPSPRPATPLPGRVGAAHRVVDPRRSRPTPTPPRSPRAGSSTGSTPGSASTPRAGARRRCCSPASPSRSSTSARTSRPSATTARSSSTRCSIAALALPELDRDGLLEFAVAELDRNLADRLPPRRRPPRGLDALPRDRAALVRRRARERAPLRGRAPAPGFDERLARACAFAAHCTRPDGTIPALSDADTRRLRAAARPGRRAARRRRAALRRLARARGPHAGGRHVSFPDGGYHVQRSGWDPERALPDLRLRPARRRRPRPLRPAELRGARPAAAPLVVDPGAAATPRSRRTCAAGSAAPPRTTRSASTGSTRRPTRRGRPRGPVAHGRLLGRAARPGSTCSPARRISPAYEAVHQRRIAFVDDALLDRRGPPRAASASTATTCASTSRREAQGATRVDGATRCARPASRSSIAGAEAVALEPGWVAPRYGRAARGAGRQRGRARDERALRHAARAGRAGAAAGVDGDRIVVDGAAIDL